MNTQSVPGARCPILVENCSLIHSIFGVNIQLLTPIYCHRPATNPASAWLPGLCNNRNQFTAKDIQAYAENSVVTHSNLWELTLPVVIYHLILALFCTISPKWTCWTRELVNLVHFGLIARDNDAKHQKSFTAWVPFTIADPCLPRYSAM